MTQHRSR